MLEKHPHMSKCIELMKMNLDLYFCKKKKNCTDLDMHVFLLSVDLYTYGKKCPIVLYCFGVRCVKVIKYIYTISSSRWTLTPEHSSHVHDFRSYTMFLMFSAIFTVRF